MEGPMENVRFINVSLTMGTMFQGGHMHLSLHFGNLCQSDV